MTAQECRRACDKLGRLASRLTSSKECYIAGNGKCRQDGKRGRKTSLVCVEQGNMQIHKGMYTNLNHYYTNTFQLILS